eukprot:7449213-Ditylum_brightwellii.AAC.1
MEAFRDSLQDYHSLSTVQLLYIPATQNLAHNVVVSYLILDIILKNESSGVTSAYTTGKYEWTHAEQGHPINVLVIVPVQMRLAVYTKKEQSQQYEVAAAC